MISTKSTHNQAQSLGSFGHVHVFQRLLLEQSILPGDVVVDATTGNGNDSLMLIHLVGPTGFLYGFDIQAEAIERTRCLLTENHYANFKLVQESHAEFNRYIHEPVKGFLFNLGYLPKGDKTVTTQWHSTEEALNGAMNLLEADGFIGVTTYPGHESGLEEDLEIQAFFGAIDQKLYQISVTQFINHKNNPPKLYWLTKRRRVKD